MFLIHSIHGFRVVAIELVERRDWILVERASLHVVNSMNTEASLTHPVRLCLIVILSVGHRLRILDLRIAISAEVARRPAGKDSAPT